MSEHPSFGALPVVLVVSLLLMSEIVGVPGTSPTGSGRTTPASKKLGPAARARLNAHVPERFEVDLRRTATPADFAALWSRCVRVVQRDYVHRRAWVIAPGHELAHVAELPAVTRISCAAADRSSGDAADAGAVTVRSGRADGI